jgi:hypothetical protein
MQRLIARWTLQLLATASILAGADERTLTVFVYNQARINDEILVQAEKNASEIFQHAGVRLVWRDGFAYANERRNATTPAVEDPATVVVKIQPESDAARYHVRSVCGGFALGINAVVFVRRFDATWLGYVVAHEIGHILLGSNAHSIVGIMRPTLLQTDWTKAEQGTLDFTASQKKQILAWIINRKAVLP